MRWLARRGYQTVTMSDVAGALAAGRLPERAVAVTFDDAYQNVFRDVVPVLQTHRFRVTVFVPTARVGRDNAWGNTRIPRLAIASWSEIAEAVALGVVEVGGHTCNHPHLGQIPVEEARAEIVDSRHEIEDRLGVPAQSFCYPYGDVTPAVRALVAGAGYRAACTTRWGHVCLGDDPFTLRRIRVYHTMLFPEFWMSLTPAAERYRAALRRFKSRDADRVSPAR
jgi:peptidoglycan/xylan/chitin deacetylase (PgdA/CDA1 family)